ncbi:MAG: hypothetical protein WAU68_12370 [Vitreimonas sp.]
MKAILTTAMWAVLAGAAFAQNADIIVQGRPNQAAAHAFVDSLSIAPPSAGVMGRWNDDICPGVSGVSPANAQRIIDQIARRANAAGLRTGEPGCSPNITIVVTPDGNQFAHQVYAQRRALLTGPNGVQSSSLGEAALQAFINTPRPIRWWHVTQTVMDDGQVLSDDGGRALQGNGGASARANSAAASGQPGGAGGEGVSGLPVTRSSGTLLRRTTRQDFHYVLVIVDATLLAGASVPAIADYVAFVSLAQINPDLNTASYPTILNLFSNTQPRPTEMTAWDTGYLDGLYHMTRNARTISAQRSEIAERLSR